MAQPNDHTRQQTGVQPGADDPEHPEDTTYDPAPEEVNRAREQGNGVGQSDMDRQGDPTRTRSADQY